MRKEERVRNLLREKDELKQSLLEKSTVLTGIKEE